MKNSGRLTMGLITLVAIASLIALSCAGGARAGDVGFKSSYDVVIIGAGGAAVSSAIAAGAAITRPSAKTSAKQSKRFKRFIVTLLAKF